MRDISSSLWYNDIHNHIGGDFVMELYHKLLQDVRKCGIMEDFTLELKPYSKTYYGRYDPNKNKITVYIYSDKECTELMDYKDLLFTVIHEAVHCIQWHDESFVRVRGVMHDAEFYRLYSEYEDRAKALLYFREVKSCEKRQRFILPCVTHRGCCSPCPA